MKTTITISRQMGSGGSYVGQLIATRLGLKYVDREVLHLAAQEFGLDDAAVAARAEKITSFWQKILSGLTFGTPDSPYSPPPLRTLSDRQLFEKQTEILKKIASKHDCVVVGWAGVYVLPRHPGMFSLFCHAPARFRLRRIMEIYHLASVKEARAMIEESDEMRKTYFSAMMGCDWACAENYHLSIDTSLFPLEEIASLIIDILERKQIVKSNPA